ncbi:MAG: phosphate ABC transporter ATP-binding protein [Acidobacteriota bacterium]|nr:phosphate ABC transporter ATP-binding protein [Acidobacteriota bacterium]
MLACQDLHIEFSRVPVVKGISLEFPVQKITAIIGPSGCGKSTLLRALNRMHDLTPGARVTGTVTLDGRDIYDKAEDAVLVRRQIGMVFQKPNPFPTMSIFENVIAGLKLVGVRNRGKLREAAESALVDAALWDEVKDRLKSSPMSLSGGQQQRLCIARALAVDPKVLLMDEPCSALDPIATAKIEELLFRLRERLSVVIVTHNMQQAARVSDYTAFLWMGKLIETDLTEKMFTNPRERTTEDYITGRFG